MRTTAALAGLVAAAGCGPTGAGNGADAARADGGGAATDASAGPVAVFDPAVLEVRVEIDFERGKAPYTGPILGFGDTFAVARANLERLLAGRKGLTLPTTLAYMEDLGDLADDELTIDDLLALAAAHRDQHDSPRVKTYYVLVVGGHYVDGNGVQPGVLGVTLGDTGVVALFKDVIASTATPTTPNLERYVEQSTLIHELGHALGLVQFGVPVTSPHHDDDHGAHCANPDCVMHWINEGAADMAGYAARYVVSGDVILFDAACLADVDALTGGP